MNVAALATLLAGFAGQAEAPANTWMPHRPVLEQPKDPAEQGSWTNAGWNKLVYDAAGRRVLFYDRWVDAKHGGYTIYGNCLFAFDPATSKLAPLKISNWLRVKDQHYRTVPLPEDEREPSPCDRHVYHAFDLVPDLRAVFLCNGANQAAVQGDVKGHDLCHNTWRYDLEKKSWTRFESKEHPRNDLEDGMAYGPATNSIVYAGHGKVWILDLATMQWRKARRDLPREHMGMTVFYDPPRRRFLLVGGGSYDRMDNKEAGFNAVYAFDPGTEELARLGDSPIPHCRGALAYDSKRDLFFSVVNFESKSGAQPAGVFRYDPKSDAWGEVRGENAIPMKKSFGQAWMPLCYDSAGDFLVGMAGDSFFTFRYAPP
jgi:hypothetical protein